jgi:hypothetical protein
MVAIGFSVGNIKQLLLQEKLICFSLRNESEFYSEGGND